MRAGPHGTDDGNVDLINGTWLELALRQWPTSREEFSRFLRWVQECRCASTVPLTDDAAQRCLRVLAGGVYIERADNTARILT